MTTGVSPPRGMRFLHRANPLISRISARLGRSSSFRDSALRSWEIAPAEVGTAPSALFDPADLEKITGVGADDTLQEQIQRARGGPAQHRATIAYELGNAVLSGGHLFTSRARQTLGGHRAPFLVRRPEHQFGHAVLASSPYGMKYFGHWMADDLPLVLAAREIGRPISALTRPSPAQRSYSDLLDLNVEALDEAFFEKIVVIDDTGQNAYRRARLQALRRTVAHMKLASPWPGVMLLRGSAGVGRVLLNEDEVAQIAVERGFRVMDPLATDTADMLSACVDTGVVLGVEGSNLTNGMMWMSQQGTLVAIQPPSRFMVILKDWCDAIGVRYAFVIGEQSDGNSFRVSTDSVSRMLDRVMR